MNGRKILMVALAGTMIGFMPGCFPEFPPEGGGPRQEQPEKEAVYVEVQHGEEATHENLSITFLGVLDDSRCPIDVECVWAGNARIALALRSLPDGMAERVELNTHDSFPRSVEFEGYNITLADLKPDRVSTVIIDPRDYVATIEIVKK